jgi:hypothetical protein
LSSVFSFWNKERTLPIVRDKYPTIRRHPPFAKKLVIAVKYVSINPNLLYIRYCGIAGVIEQNNTHKKPKQFVIIEIIGSIIPFLFLRFRMNNNTGTAIKKSIIIAGRKSLKTRKNIPSRETL